MLAPLPARDRLLRAMLLLHSVVLIEPLHDLVASTWFALAGPKGLPNEIVQRLNQNNGMKK